MIVLHFTALCRHLACPAFEIVTACPSLRMLVLNCTSASQVPLVGLKTCFAPIADECKAHYGHLTCPTLDANASETEILRLFLYASPHTLDIVHAPRTVQSTRIISRSARFRNHAQARTKQETEQDTVSCVKKQDISRMLSKIEPSWLARVKERKGNIGRVFLFFLQIIGAKLALSQAA